MDNSGGKFRTLVTVKLAPEEIEQPALVLKDFCSFAHLSQSREYLWAWLKTTVAGNYTSGLTKKEREDLLYFYEQLERLVEAVHLVNLKEETI